MRFNYRIPLIFLFFAVYILLEINLNLKLIDLYSNPVTSVLGAKAEEAHFVEFLGRMITGFGLALALVTLIPELSFERKYRSAFVRRSIRLLMFLALWAVLIPSIRVVVDSVVENSSPEQKMNAVRAVIFKEAYLADMVAIDDLERLSVSNETQSEKKLVVSLIPSLAYFSERFNGYIGRQLDELTNVYIRNYQNAAFTRDAVPKLNSLSSLYEQEMELYSSAQRDAREVMGTVQNYDNLEAKTREWHDQAVQLLNTSWDSYVSEYEKASDLADTITEQIYDDYRDQAKDYERVSCNADCKERIRVNWSNFITSLTWEDGSKIQLYFEPDEPHFYLLYLFGRENHFKAYIQNARRAFLNKLWGVEEDVTYESFINNDKVISFVITQVRKLEMPLSVNWKPTRMDITRSDVEKYYAGKGESVWKRYYERSEFDVSNRSLNRVEFLSCRKLRLMHATNWTRFILMPTSPICLTVSIMSSGIIGKKKKPLVCAAD
ncbi:hypothetical protein [Pseudidiomarina halophila]|uniref:hypothetical protein n=1 Tax=Pseudidiomarina halophila TaxID=1449799 RepID=UPI0036156457